MESTGKTADRSSRIAHNIMTTIENQVSYNCLTETNVQCGMAYLYVQNRMTRETRRFLSHTRETVQNSVCVRQENLRAILIPGTK